MHQGVKIRIFPTTISPKYALDLSYPMLNAIKQEIKLAKKNNIKLILHLHEYHNLHGLMIAKKFKNQFIVAQHHGGSWPVKHLKENKKYKPFFPIFLLAQLWENKVLKNIDYFFALSPEEIKYLKKITDSKIKFQTMGLIEDYFKKVDKKTARKKLKLPLNKNILLFIGRINEVKGIPYLLEAMKNLKEVDLKIAGYLQNVDKFRKYAKQGNLDNVEFLGGVFGDKKRLYLSSADALILPSSKEGAPVTVMEALARNTPVIVTNVGGVPLMVKNKENGLIIKQKNPKDIVRAVNEIIKNPIKNVSKSSEKYNWEKIIEQTVKIYQEL